MMPLVIALKTIKYLRINITKFVKEFHSKNCITMMKEMKEGTNKWKEILNSLIVESNTI
jgi:hypothetical protein